MRNSVFVVLIMLFVFYPRSDAMAQDYVTVGGDIACITRTHIEEWKKYLIEKDYVVMESLLKDNLCFTLEGGYPVYLESSTSGGLVEIRPLRVRHTLWTNIEAIKKK
ncbi:MAG: hypothetical protein IH964_11920 [Candidatus Dadabacteria bacterium]|nr:hypothetical protein [Candidatus Dadabacteria bacterium]